MCFLTAGERREPARSRQRGGDGVSSVEEPNGKSILLPMPWSGQGYPAAPAAPILISLSNFQTHATLISLSSFQTHATAQSDPLAPKPGILKPSKAPRRPSHSKPTPQNSAEDASRPQRDSRTGKLGQGGRRISSFRPPQVPPVPHWNVGSRLTVAPSTKTAATAGNICAGVWGGYLPPMGGPDAGYGRDRPAWGDRPTAESSLPPLGGHAEGVDFGGGGLGSRQEGAREAAAVSPPMVWWGDVEGSGQEAGSGSMAPRDPTHGQQQSFPGELTKAMPVVCWPQITLSVLP